MSNSNISNSLAASQEKTLALCRTPFQAVMLKAVLKKECINYFDFIYLTQDDSEEDRCYFKELESRAQQSQYIYMQKQTFDICNHIGMYLKISNRFKHKTYQKILISSYDHLALRKLSVKNSNTSIISFDDGIANIVKQSGYWNIKHSFRERFYSWGFRVPNRNKYIHFIKRHYSAYPEYGNLMPEKIIRYIEPFNRDHFSVHKEKGLTFFIGQPFSEYLSHVELESLMSYVNDLSVDYYVKHPRESHGGFTDIPFLPKGGRIAEEAIFIASNGKRPLIYGGFSTVLINISSAYADKVMLLRRNNPNDKSYAEMGKKAGCEIEYI